MHSVPIRSRLAAGAVLLVTECAAQAQLYGRVDLGYSHSVGANIEDNNFAQGESGFRCRAR